LEVKLSAAEFDGEHNSILSSLLFLNLKILYAINVDKNVFPVPGGPWIKLRTLLKTLFNALI